MSAERAGDVGSPDVLDREIHVWHASVVALAPLAPELEGLLDEGEREHAARFHFERDRTRHIVSHGVLRVVLARYLDRHAASLRFGAGEFGKPYLTAPACGISFNLSHSGDVVLVAVARERAVGVDVEQVAGDVEYDSLARIAFSPAERRALERVPAAERRAAFFACWARKEAYIKATGYGVSQGLDQFDVALGRDAALLADRHDENGATRWSMRSLAVADAYAAAIAFDGGDVPVVLRAVTPVDIRSAVARARG